MRTPILFITALIFLTGCYTITKHPAVAVNSERPDKYFSVPFNSECSSCHTEKELEDFRIYYPLETDTDMDDISRPYYTYSSDDLYSYYNIMPWWFNFNFVKDDLSVESGISEPVIYSPARPGPEPVPPPLPPPGNPVPPPPQNDDSVKKRTNESTSTGERSKSTSSENTRDNSGDRKTERSRR